MPTIVIGELFAGFSLGSKYKENENKLQLFLNQYAIMLTPPDLNIAKRYGEIIVDLRLKGKPIPTNDIWIASTAMETNSNLLSNDIHFNHITGLQVHNFNLGN